MSLEHGSSVGMSAVNSIDFEDMNNVAIVKIHFDRFDVIVKNLSQPLEFWANLGCFWRLSPQDGVRIIFNHPDYLYYFRMRNLPERFVQIGWIVFELAKKM